MIYPKFLTKDSCIGVPAPSSGAYDDLHIAKYANSKLKLEKMGYSCVLSDNINKSEMARSASAEKRAEEFNKMVEDEKINFIMCAAGGEFLVEILPYIDFEKMIKNPKFVQGFSDPTGLLFPITTKYDVATIYGNNFGEYGVEEYDRSIEDNIQILQGNLIEQNSYEMFENESASIDNPTGLEGYNFTDKVEWKVLDMSNGNYYDGNSENSDSNSENSDSSSENNGFNSENTDNKENKEDKEDKEILIEGRIIGGCLEVIMDISGTKYDGTQGFIEKYKNDGIIWYFDNYGLSKESLICKLWKLNELGYFKYTKGIIFGRNGTEESYLGYTMEKALKDSVLAKLNVPIIYDADISHKGPCMTIINGAIATVRCKDGKGSIKFDLIN
jgi:muramoyltetrapeptide carboxypeptidase LdcA involved in peptidoglycan recycling